MTAITGVRTISVPVGDQDAALHFYTETLGFTLQRDNPTPDGGRRTATRSPLPRPAELFASDP